MPDAVLDRPSEILSPHHPWHDPMTYTRQAQELAHRFVQNFEQFKGMSEAIVPAAPNLIQSVDVRR